MQRLVLLGATGSIGQQTIDILKCFPEQFTVVGMSAKSNAQQLFQDAVQFTKAALFLAEAMDTHERRVENVEDLITDSMDHLIVADHGLNSYPAVLKALAMGKRVSIANKELLIAHGQDLMYLAREQQVTVVPIDSEHNALFQCFQGERMSDIHRVIITASGGPFRNQDWASLSEVTPEQVLDHPTWNMGAKTTVDSATLVNKAFEVIETHILFDLPYEKIEVRIHPESIVHAIVEFTDGNAKMLAYQPDMRFAIGYALFFPERAPESLIGDRDALFAFDQDLHFERLQEGRYPCFDAAVEIAREQPDALRQLLENDEQAVSSFLDHQIGFTDILDTLSQDLS